MKLSEAGRIKVLSGLLGVISGALKVEIVSMRAGAHTCCTEYGNFVRSSRIRSLRYFSTLSLVKDDAMEIYLKDLIREDL